jgi:hypothetical protein
LSGVAHVLAKAGSIAAAFHDDGILRNVLASIIKMAETKVTRNARNTQRREG